MSVSNIHSSKDLSFGCFLLPAGTVGFLDDSIRIGITHFFLKEEILSAPKSKAVSRFSQLNTGRFLAEQSSLAREVLLAIRDSQLLTRPKMNALKYFLTILALTGAFAISARAATDVPSVPDSGGTVMLLGGALAGLALLGRYRKR